MAIESIKWEITPTQVYMLGCHRSQLNDSLPEKIQNATGCTFEDAVEAIRLYGELAAD